MLKNTFKDITISIDTFWADTAKKCVSSGADIINDISAGEMDNKMFPTIAKLNVPYIMMHMQGTPQNMQKKPKEFNESLRLRWGEEATNVIKLKEL